MSLESEFEVARAQYRDFLAAVPVAARTVAIHDVDADGLAAGVVWQKVMERAGYAPQRVTPNRERNAWTSENRARLETAAPEFLWALDLGSQSVKILPEVPTCFIDHHHPEGVPEGDTLISGYAWKPIPNTSWMMWEIGKAVANVEDLDWIAVIGTLSDLGEKAPWEQIDLAKKKYTAKWLKEATALVNAPRRSAHFEAELGAVALLEHQNPRDLCESNSESGQALREARREVAAALEEGKKAAPKFAGHVALIRVNSPCQIHPLIAQIWRSRLPKYLVICANEGYMPDRINFSARSGVGINALEYLRSIKIAAGDGDFGHGHDQATGGSLPRERWNELLEKMGFGTAV